jgi:WD40 repeat protein
VLDVALSQDGVLGASCSDDFFVKVWDLEHKECLQTCKGHTGWVVCVKVGASVLDCRLQHGSHRLLASSNRQMGLGSTYRFRHYVGAFAYEDDLLEPGP